jgi:S1-C subfamily serine protease
MLVSHRPSSLVTRYSLLLTLLLALAAPPARADPDAGELLSWARPKVVLVFVQTDGPPRWGTGFLAEHGRIITNVHVIQDARSVTVWANGAPYPARVAAVDTPRDLAALVVPGTSLELKPLTLARDGRDPPGEPVVILASRVQTSRGLRQVHVWPVAGSMWGYTWLHWPNGLADFDLRLQATAIPGDSGSPVLRLRDGAVVGILRGRTNPDPYGRSDTAWAVPVEAAHALLARIHDPLPAPDSPPDRYYLDPLAGR